MRNINWIIIHAFISLICGSHAREYEDVWYWGTFPNNFVWATATSDYQIEGAWNVDGKGWSNWDDFVRENDTILDGTNGDVACDSYNRYKEDVKLLQDMKVPYYRFSIAWPRILPEGRGWVPNPLGVQYYKNVISELKKAGIEPVVTLYHWTTPKTLEQEGGWLNSDIIEAFYNYSRICFDEFGNDVKYWITFNEPWVSTFLAYGTRAKAPGLNSPAELPYQASRNLLLANARVWHLYDQQYRSTQNGNIGITLNGGWAEPLDPADPTHLAACERYHQFTFGWFAEPIFGDGDYPQVMRDMIALKSEQQGYNKSRLPSFTEEEKALLRGTSDFFGLNYYGAGLHFPQENPLQPPSYGSDSDVGQTVDEDWIGSGSTWLWVTPWSLRKMLNWITNTYNKPPILITENGVSDRNGSLTDAHRVYYYRHYINNVLKAINLDGNNVIGYTAWSLMDNFEWEMGYVEKFGMHYVNFSDPARPRTAKDSARFYTTVIEDNGFPDPNSASVATINLWFMIVAALTIFVI